MEFLLNILAIIAFIIIVNLLFGRTSTTLASSFPLSRLPKPDLSKYPAHIEISREEKQYYLSSPQWQAKRQLIITRDKVCRACQGYANEVHHLHYRTWKQEQLKDLVLLCRDCHENQHQHYGFSYNTTYFPIIYPKSRLKVHL
jgi:hypothetical protein